MGLCSPHAVVAVLSGWRDARTHRTLGVALAGEFWDLLCHPGISRTTRTHARTFCVGVPDLLGSGTKLRVRVPLSMAQHGHFGSSLYWLL